MKVAKTIKFDIWDKRELKFLLEILPLFAIIVYQHVMRIVRLEIMMKNKDVAQWETDSVKFVKINVTGQYISMSHL